MSLLYNADGDIALSAVSSLAMPTTAGAIGQWVYLTDDTTRQVWCGHTGTDSAIGWRGDLAGDELQCYREGSVAYAEARAPIANFAVYALNKWLYVLFAWSATASKIYMGDETTAPAEPSAYSVGYPTLIDTPTTVTGQIGLGNAAGAPTRWVRGRIGSWELYDATPNLAQADLCRLGTWPARHYLSFGRNGTTDIPDITGNGLTATITALSSPDIEPGPPNGGRSWYGRAGQLGA